MFEPIIEDIAASLASDLITRTSETARVQQMVQLSLAPVFLLAAIGAVAALRHAATVAGHLLAHLAVARRGNLPEKLAAEASGQLRPIPVPV